MHAIGVVGWCIAILLFTTRGLSRRRVLPVGAPLNFFHFRSLARWLRLCVRLSRRRCLRLGLSLLLRRLRPRAVACNDLRLNEQHLDLLSVNIGLVCFVHLVVMVRSHRVHGDQLRDRGLIDLPFLDFELEPDYGFLEAVGEFRRRVRRNLRFFLHNWSRLRLICTC